MSKPFQRIALAEQSRNIDIGFLFKNGFIENHCEIHKNLSWTDYSGSLNGSIGIESSLTATDKSELL
ncbi:MAG: hypothetical protein IPG02_04220 [Ignavibacteria bacterium]|nr:hypothetical protein [Ignavibacteria bacterium]